MTELTNDPQIAAVAELQEGMVPIPEDFMLGMSPFTVLWYSWMALNETVTVWTAQLASDSEVVQGDGAEVGDAFNHLMSAMGSITEACVLVSLLPPEASVSNG